MENSAKYHMHREAKFCVLRKFVSFVFHKLTAFYISQKEITINPSIAWEFFCCFFFPTPHYMHYGVAIIKRLTFNIKKKNA